MLTEENIKTMPPRTIFAEGVVSSWFDDEENNIRWCACRGDDGHWLINYETEAWDKDRVRQYGHRLKDQLVIRRLQPCTADAMKLYNYGK